MIFDQLTGALYADNGEFLKTVRCPLALRPEQLIQSSAGTPDRFCNSCRKSIRCIDELTDDDVQSALSEDMSLCVFATSKAKNIVFLQRPGATNRNYNNFLVIQTMRSLEAMDDAQARGFNLVFKDTGVKNTFGVHKCLLLQHNPTGKLWWSHDYRYRAPLYGEIPDPDMSYLEREQWELRMLSKDINDDSDSGKWEQVRDWFYVRPDCPFPLAAYAVPKALKPGERVFLEDLIEDVPQQFWNQGSAHRLVSSAATWNGLDFDVDEAGGLEVVG